MPLPAAVVTTKKLTKRYGDVTAVDGLTLAVAPGEVFGLVGPDGAGKTTTLRMLAAILLPSAGRATVLGRDTVREAEAIKGHIGYMGQRFNLYRDLTVGENLAFFADVFGVTGEERRGRLRRMLAFAHLESFEGRRAEQLSGGMQKKLALACTLIHRPQVLFLDEPTTGVDPASRREFWDILTDLHLEGITIVVSTPYMDEADRCSRVGLMYRGRLVVCDTPRAIRSMVKGELLEVRGPDLRRAREVVAQVPGVMEVQTYGDRLHVFVDDSEARGAALAQALADAGVSLQSLRPTRPRMEEAYISLVRDLQEASRGA